MAHPRLACSSFHATFRAQFLQWEVSCPPGSTTRSWYAMTLARCRFAPICTRVHGPEAASCESTGWAQRCRLCPHRLQRFFPCRCCSQGLKCGCSCGLLQEWFVLARMCLRVRRCYSLLRKPKIRATCVRTGLFSTLTNARGVNDKGKQMNSSLFTDDCTTSTQLPTKLRLRCKQEEARNYTSRKYAIKKRRIIRSVSWLSWRTSRARRTPARDWKGGVEAITWPRNAHIDQQI